MARGGKLRGRERESSWLELYILCWSDVIYYLFSVQILTDYEMLFQFHFLNCLMPLLELHVQKPNIFFYQRDSWNSQAQSQPQMQSFEKDTMSEIRCHRWVQNSKTLAYCFIWSFQWDGRFPKFTALLAQLHRIITSFLPLPGTWRWCQKQDSLRLETWVQSDVVCVWSMIDNDSSKQMGNI